MKTIRKRATKICEIDNIIISYRKKKKYAYIFYSIRNGNGYLECQIPMKTKTVTIRDSWNKLNLRAKTVIPYTDDNISAYLKNQGKIHNDQLKIILGLEKYMLKVLTIPNKII